MGFLKEEALRLLREKWANPTMLAEELYVILQSNIPTSVDGPLIINNPGNQPPIQIEGGTGDFVIQVIKRNPDGTTTTLTLDFGGQLSQDGEPVQSEATPRIFMGKIVSGTGDTYQVDLYEHGSQLKPGLLGRRPIAATRQVTATVPQIDPSETIPAGTWIAAVYEFTHANEDTTYEFQPPVWL